MTIHVQVSVLLVVLAGVVAACGSHGQRVVEDDPDAAREAGALPVTGDFSDAATPPGPGCFRCSRDLHAVLDCDGRLLKTCPPDQGCAVDRCVPACEAARVNGASIGCDYYAIPSLGNNDGFPSTCLALVIANTWGTPVRVGIERAGKRYSNVGYVARGAGTKISYTPLAGDTVPPGEAGIFFLSAEGEHCPKPTAVIERPPTGSGVEKAWHVETDAPVVATLASPYGGGNAGTTAATLLLPTSAWGDNHVLTSASPERLAGPADMFVGVVAKEDGTDVTILPTEDLASGGAKNVPKTYRLAKGELLRWMQQADLSGSVVQSTKPVGAFGGSKCVNIPSSQGYCDGAIQQLPSVKAMGNEYVAVRYRSRWPGQEESPPWRLVGVVDGTTLTYDPPQPGAPQTLSRGQVVLFSSPGPFVVRSQGETHPFYAAAHMTGSTSGPATPMGRPGDPDFVNVVAPAQYLSSYVFFTDPTFSETNLVLVRAKGQDGKFHEVSLDCRGVLQGWKPVGDGGKYEWVRADMVTANFDRVGRCDNGRHEIRSDAPFGLTIWGWGSAATGGNPFPDGPGGGFAYSTFTQDVSYGYPAGMNLVPINQIVVPAVPK